MPPGKDKAVAPSAEISRLNALITKDPRSKLFVPLAEEYMKAGMTDLAVQTLERGLLANPYYMSARVLLGKARLEQGEADMAREEFELVVKTVPDNLFAHRKLGEIYLQQGRRTEAARAFRMVSILNPKDEEAKRFVELIDSGAMSATEEAGKADKAQELPHSSTATAVEELPLPHQEEQSPQAFDISETEEQASEGPEPEDEPSVMEMPVPEMETLAAVQEERLEEEQPVEEEPSSATSGYSLNIGGDAGLDEILSAYEEPAAVSDEAPEETGGVYEIPEELSGVEIEGLVVRPPGSVAEEPPEASDAFETKTLAELYCAQGFFDRAIGIYKNLLSDDPDNKELKSKLEELYWRAGVATAGAAPEAREYPAGGNGEKIRRLEQFLDAIKRKAGR